MNRDTTPSAFRIGRFRLLPQARELWHDDVRVKLPPKSLDCVLYLIGQRDRAVGRDELISAVWGRVDVSDALLAQTLSRARRAFSDHGVGEEIIRTVPRFGYRWVASAEPCEAIVPGAPEAHFEIGDRRVVADASAARSRMRIAPGIAAALALIAGAALAAWWALRDRPALVATQGSIVVMPVDVSDAEPEYAWMRLGLMDYFARRLRQDAHLPVLPSEQTLKLLGTGSATPSGGERDLDRVTKAATASLVLVPRAKHAGDRWTVSLEARAGKRSSTLEATDPSPLRAAEIATNRWLAAQGRPEIPAVADSGEDVLLQRIDAALLSGDLDAAKALASDVDATTARNPAFRIRMGRIAFRSGALDAAARTFESLAATEKRGSRTRAEADLGLAAVATRKNDLDTGIKRYDAAIAELPEHVDATLQSRAFMERGVARGLVHQYDSAMSDFGVARGDLAQTGDRLGIATLDTNVAIVEGRRGHAQDALAAYQRAARTFAELGVEDSLAITLANQSGVQQSQLDDAGALASAERAWSIARSLENPLAVEFVGIQYASALIANGRLDDARAVVDRFYGPATQAKADAIFAVMSVQLLQARGRTSDAHALMTAPAMAEAFRSDPGIVTAAAPVFVDIALRLEDLAGADRMLAMLRATPSATTPAAAFTLELVEGEVSAAHDDGDAQAHFDKALAIADGDARPDDLLAAGVAAARYAIARRDRLAAMSIAGRLVPFADRNFAAARACQALYEFLDNTAMAARCRADSTRLAGERSLAGSF